MQVLAKWGWSKKNIPQSARRSKHNLAKIMAVKWRNVKFDPDKSRHSDTVLITGDGNTLPNEVAEFEGWGVNHDLFCVNRSALFFERPINHWASIDAEESSWLSKYFKREHVSGNGRMLRHTIGVCRYGYDIFWEPLALIENDYQARLWVGNSGYFGLLVSVALGYKKIVLAGMPLNKDRHWYDAEEEPGPSWVPETYTTWMDYKMAMPDADKVRSMGGYSAFILGQATKEWVNDH